MSSLAPRDRLDRPLRSLRLSVTDRCNLRCAYCMPEESYKWLEREDLLSFEELTRLVRIFVGLGVSKVRLTGGEPLIRRELWALVRELTRVAPGLDLGLTTNAVHLAEQAQQLYDAGLSRLTISLDTLDRERFRALTRRDALDDVLRGIEAAARVGFRNGKLNVVVMRGVNDTEIVELLSFAKRHHLEARFIEYMDVGGATRWQAERVVSRDEILAIITSHVGEVEAVPTEASAPARRYSLGDGTTFGVIASTTAPFCRDCDRTRITADGTMFSCLYASRGLELRAVLRNGASDEAIAAHLASAWQARDARGAEERLLTLGRGPTFARDELTRDPRLEMHTRGG